MHGQLMSVRSFQFALIAPFFGILAACGSGLPECNSKETQAGLMDNDFRLVYLQSIGNSKAFQEERRTLSDEFDSSIDRMSTATDITLPELQRHAEVMKRLKAIDKRHLAAAAATLSDFREMRRDVAERRVACSATFAVRSGDSRSEASVSYEVSRNPDGTVRVDHVDGTLTTDKNDGYIVPLFAYAKDEVADTR